MTKQILTAGKLYLSMTVLPERLSSEFFKSVICHLQQQTCHYEKIIINIPFIYQKTNTPYTIPKWLATEASVLINRCEDMGPATKILGYYAQLKPEDSLCIIDDDIIYKPTMLENLYAAHLEHPTYLISTFVDRLGSPTGYSGYIFKKKFFDIHEADIQNLLSYCYSVDDTWLGKIARQKNITISGLSDDWLASMNRELTDMHPEWYELCKDTSRKKLMDKCLCENSLNEKTKSKRNSFLKRLLHKFNA